MIAEKEIKKFKKYSLEELASIAGGLIDKGKTIPLEKIVRKHYHLYEKLLENAFSYFYMIDFQRMKYVYISKSIINVLGYGSDYYMKGGLEFTFETICPEDRNKLKVIHKKMFEYFYSIPVEERKKLKFEFNLRVTKADKSIIHLLHQTIFVELNDRGEPSLDFSTCTDITKYKTDNNIRLTIYKIENSCYRQLYEYEIYDLQINLTKRQVEIIALISQGLTSCQIANKLFLSVETVKNHRKKILQITGAKNIAEAIKIAFGK